MGWGMGEAKIFGITLTYKKDTLLYICDFQNPMIYEPILVSLLNTDLYVVISKLSILFILGGGGGGGYMISTILVKNEVLIAITTIRLLIRNSIVRTTNKELQTICKEIDRYETNRP